MLQYRKEIDGLRAIAVFPVVLFHAGFQAFSGGFVGVDVFFVISGYLITSIILADKATGSFCLRRFYERRARRILPPLFLVMFVCIPFAFLWMLPDNLKSFGQSLTATSLFANNILLSLTSDYFGLEAEFKPLLHTWSLGVEEQYYLFFPILMMLFWHKGKRFLLCLLALLAVASFCVAEVNVFISPEAAFYQASSRAWELLVGALIACYLFFYDNPQKVAFHRFTCEFGGIIGIGLIAFAVFGYGKATPFPGFYALIPVVGTGLIILCATNQSYVGRLLGHRAFVGLGLISYSLYLWHQPLLAFGRLNNLDEPDGGFLMGLIFLALAFAFLSWKYVEKPFRRGSVGRHTLYFSAVIATLSMSTLGYFIHSRSGFVYRWDELNSGLKEGGRRLNGVFNEGPYRFLNKEFTAPDKSAVLVLGNSFARDFINAGLENNYFSRSEISYSIDYPKCLQSERDVSAQLRPLVSRSDYLVFASGDISIECWRKDFSILQGLGAKRIIVLGTKNFGWNMNAVMRLVPEQRFTYRAKVLEGVWRWNTEMAMAIPDIYFVDLLSLLADSERRISVFTTNRKIISQDGKHLTKEGAKYVGQIIFKHHLLREFI